MAPSPATTPTNAARPSSRICARKRFWLSFTISGIKPKIPLVDAGCGVREAMIFSRSPYVCWTIPIVYGSVCQHAKPRNAAIIVGTKRINHRAGSDCMV